MRISRLWAEHHPEPFGIGEATPRLSFAVDWTEKEPSPSGPAGYRLAVSGPARETTVVELTPDQTQYQPWPGVPLASRERVEVRVDAIAADGGVLASGSWPVEAGLLAPSDWTAAMITPGTDEPADASGVVHGFRREFSLGSPVVSARLYASAWGLYQFWLNGRVVGDQVLAPGWTSYAHRLRHQTYDVTDLLAEGGNALAAAVGEGWYRGRIGFEGGRRHIWGELAGLFAQLEITCADGSVTRVVTGPDWTSGPTPITWSGIYDGETQDLRLGNGAWLRPGFSGDGWTPVRTAAFDPAILVAPDGPPVRRTQELAVQQVLTSPSGQTLLDFGQNLVGWLRLRATGPAGTTITVRHAEVLEHGELGVRPLRLARATDTYTLAGTGEPETCEPVFTFHGFRYASVEGWPGELDPSMITAVVVHTDLPRTGEFECSDPMLNRLHDNVVWGMRGNVVDVPTDCPQRDERLGWTGDLGVFGPTAAFLYDSAGFLRSWLSDLDAEQLAHKNRVPPMVVPDAIDPGHFFSNPEGNAVAGWGDVVTVLPWTLYERYGDREFLRRQYTGMKAWVDRVHTLAGDRLVWDNQLQLGDWLDPSAPPDNPMAGRTDPNLCATAYFAHSARLVARAAAVLGHAADEAAYTDLADRVADAFRVEYLTPAGRVASDSQAGYALALQFGLFESPEQVRRAGERLAELVVGNRYRIGTGFLGTPLITDALTDGGHLAWAYRLLAEKGCPSFLYPITMGATTIWERWDSMLPDGSINPGDMTSFNHYALGAVADWMQRTIAGLAPAAPGYREVRLHPRPGGGLTHARASLDTRYGTVAVAWHLDGEDVVVDATLPVGVTGTLQIGADPELIPLVGGRVEHRRPFVAPAPAPEPFVPGPPQE